MQAKITNFNDFTELIGLLADQAALMGVLEMLYDRRVSLLSVECMETKTSV